MSTTDATTTGPVAERDVGSTIGEADPHHDHPPDKLYVQIAVILGVLTAVEVATYFVDTGPTETPLLLTLMIIKAIMVGMFFMHLKFDNKLFSSVFVAGFILAGAVYLATLLAFEYFA